jgi:hypothetical protein
LKLALKPEPDDYVKKELLRHSLHTKSLTNDNLLMKLTKELKSGDKLLLNDYVTKLALPKQMLLDKHVSHDNYNDKLKKEHNTYHPQLLPSLPLFQHMV